MKYIVVGKLVDQPTPAQMDRAERNGGWSEYKGHWFNACVSPGFGGAPMEVET